MRIGLFGGTFDPIHNGHLRAALDACEDFPLDQCVLIPAAKPPHKNGLKTAGVDHRLAMTRLAAEGIDKLAVSDVETQRTGPSFTIDTIRHFRRTLAAADELLLMLGADAFFEIDTWHSWQELLDEVGLLVMTRPGGATADFAVAIDAFISGHLADGYTFDWNRKGFFHRERPPIFYVPVTQLDISSTDIRRRIHRGRSVRFLLPESVARYIDREELYR